MPDLPWLPFYGDIPATIPYPNDTMYELFSRAAAEHGDQVAISYLGERVSYARLASMVEAASAGLWAIGVRPYHRIALLVPNTPQAAVVLYAANRIGAVVSLVHPDTPGPTVAELLGRLEPYWMVSSREHVAGLGRVLAAAPVRGIVLCGVEDFGRPSRHRRLARLRSRHGLGDGGLRGVSAAPSADAADRFESPPLFSWDSLMRMGSQADLPVHTTVHAPDDLAVVLFTGGTTGASHAVMHADRQLNAVAMQMQVQGPLLAGQSLLSVVPFSHGLGVAVAVHATLTAGARSIILPYFTARSLARAIRRSGPEYLVGVPATYGELVMDRVFRRSRHRSLMGAFCGGDRLPHAVRSRFAAIVRRRGGAVAIREGYGLSETVTACATMPDGEDRPGSVGIPYPDTRIAIARPEHESARRGDAPSWVATGELGEILVSGPTVMLGYMGDEEATKRAFCRDEDDTLWLRTGDLGRMDEDGFLYFVERMGRGFEVDGDEVHPGLTELLLCEHSEVLETCVTVSNGVAPPALVAHVRPVDSDRDPAWLENQLRKSMQTLDRRLQPARYDIRSRLPRTMTGAIDHRRVRAARGPGLV